MVQWLPFNDMPQECPANSYVLSGYSAGRILCGYFFPWHSDMYSVMYRLVILIFNIWDRNENMTTVLHSSVRIGT
jgi:hypothetical protein